MVIYILASILIFIEATLSIKMISMIVTFPFLTMISNRNYKVGIFFIFLISQIHSFQNEDFLRYLFIFILLYLISHLILTQMTYSKENILIFTTIQVGILALFFKKHLEIGGYIFNGVGMAIFNYIFIKISWRKQR